MASVGLRHHKNQAEAKLLYKELGSFLAASVFLAKTPTEVLDLPEQAVQDSKEEQLPLPLAAFNHLPGIFDMLSATLAAQGMVEVQVAWRCKL